MVYSGEIHKIAISIILKVLIKPQYIASEHTIKNFHKTDKAIY